MLDTAAASAAPSPVSVPPSPPARRLGSVAWTDRRMLVGLAMVAASVVGVVMLVGSADDTVRVWAVRTDLAPGTTVAATDVELEPVRLAMTDRYLPAGADPVGSVVLRPVAAGELLPVAAVAAPDAAPERRLVTVPVEHHNLPLDLRHGEAVDVYLVERDATGSSVGDPRLVLASASVDAVDDDASGFGGSSLQVGVVLSVEPGHVAALVGAAARGSVVLVRVPGA
jgi:hypothetical protein